MKLAVMRSQAGTGCTSVSVAVAADIVVLNQVNQCSKESI